MEGQGRFPSGSARAAVELHGDKWRAATADSPKHCYADVATMTTAEYLRRAGAKPAQRASWREYTQRCQRGEVHQPR